MINIENRTPHIVAQLSIYTQMILTYFSSLNTYYKVDEQVGQVHLIDSYKYKISSRSGSSSIPDLTFEQEYAFTLLNGSKILTTAYIIFPDFTATYSYSPYEQILTANILRHNHLIDIKINFFDPHESSIVERLSNDKKTKEAYLVYALPRLLTNPLPLVSVSNYPPTYTGGKLTFIGNPPNLDFTAESPWVCNNPPENLRIIRLAELLKYAVNSMMYAPILGTQPALFSEFLLTASERENIFPKIFEK